MHNFMAYDRRWLDEPHSGDHLGRTVWALGAVVAAHPPRAVAAPSLRLLEELADTVEQTDSMRTMAFSIIGLTRPPLGSLTPSAAAIARGPGRTVDWTSTPGSARPTGSGSRRA